MPNELLPNLINRVSASWEGVPTEFQGVVSNFLKSIRSKTDHNELIRFTYAAAIFQYTEYREDKFRIQRRHIELAIGVSMFHALLKWARLRNYARVELKDFENFDRIPHRGSGAQYRIELLNLDVDAFTKHHIGIAQLPKEEFMNQLKPL